MKRLLIIIFFIAFVASNEIIASNEIEENLDEDVVLEKVFLWECQVLEEQG